MDESKPMELFDPAATWKRRVYENYTIRPLQEQIFAGGELVYRRPSLEEIQRYCQAHQAGAAAYRQSLRKESKGARFRQAAAA